MHDLEPNAQENHRGKLRKSVAPTHPWHPKHPWYPNTRTKQTTTKTNHNQTTTTHNTHHIVVIFIHCFVLWFMFV